MFPALGSLCPHGWRNDDDDDDDDNHDDTYNRSRCLLIFCVSSSCDRLVTVLQELDRHELGMTRGASKRTRRKRLKSTTTRRRKIRDKAEVRNGEMMVFISCNCLLPSFKNRTGTSLGRREAPVNEQEGSVYKKNKAGEWRGKERQSLQKEK